MHTNNKKDTQQKKNESKMKQNKTKREMIEAFPFFAFQCLHRFYSIDKNLQSFFVFFLSRMV